jgi:hypothetical protein
MLVALATPSLSPKEDLWANIRLGVGKRPWRNSKAWQGLGILVGIGGILAGLLPLWSLDICISTHTSFRFLTLYASDG